MADAAQTLAQLRDIHLPEPAPWWPPAPGWWLLAAAVALTTIALWIVAGRRARTRLERRALRLLARLERNYSKTRDGAAFASQVSVLLRRVAVARFPEQQPAGLTGDAWLEFLDHTGGNGAFRNGIGKDLLTAPYRPGGELDAAKLASLARRWLQKAAGSAPQRSKAER